MAVGSPAFSISNLAFVLVEGTEAVGERERFRLLCGVPESTRFLESDSCSEALRKLGHLQSLAEVSSQKIRLGAVVDRDTRHSGQIADIEKSGAYVLAVHEVENFFLHPPTLAEIFGSNGGNPEDVSEIIVYSADQRAGLLIFDGARGDPKFKDLPAPSAGVRKLIHDLKWTDFEAAEAVCERIADGHGGLDQAQRDLLVKHLFARTKMYGRWRTGGDIWKYCEGKEVLKAVAPRLGFADDKTCERAVLAYWNRHPEGRPGELVELLDYVLSI